MFRLLTHGSCLGNPGRGAWAAQLIRPDGSESIFAGSAERTTSTQMEVVAVSEGLERVPEDEEVEVLTANANIIGWLSRGWRRNNAILRPLLARADVLLAARRVRFTLGHAVEARREVRRVKRCGGGQRDGGARGG